MVKNYTKTEKWYLLSNADQILSFKKDEKDFLEKGEEQQKEEEEFHIFIKIGFI